MFCCCGAFHWSIVLSFEWTEPAWKDSRCTIASGLDCGTPAGTCAKRLCKRATRGQWLFLYLHKEIYRVHPEGYALCLMPPARAPKPRPFLQAFPSCFGLGAQRWRRQCQTVGCDWPAASPYVGHMAYGVKCGGAAMASPRQPIGCHSVGMGAKCPGQEGQERHSWPMVAHPVPGA
jgi:hypothetical protein